MNQLYIPKVKHVVTTLVTSVAVFLCALTASAEETTIPVSIYEYPKSVTHSLSKGEMSESMLTTGVVLGVTNQQSVQAQIMELYKQVQELQAALAKLRQQKEDPVSKPNFEFYDRASSLRVKYESPYELIAKRSEDERIAKYLLAFEFFKRGTQEPMNAMVVAMDDDNALFWEFFKMGLGAAFNEIEAEWAIRFNFPLQRYNREVNYKNFTLEESGIKAGTETLLGLYTVKREINGIIVATVVPFSAVPDIDLLNQEEARKLIISMYNNTSFDVAKMRNALP